MMNDGRREGEGGMVSEGSWRWRGNEEGMRVISFQEVRNRAEGRGLVTSYVYVCTHLLRQIGKDLCTDSI